MAFKSQIYRVWCQTNQKSLYHSQHAKKSAQYINPLLRYSRFKVSLTKWPHPCLPKSTQKNINQILAFLNLHQHTKNQFIPSIHSWDTVNFRVLWPNWPDPFLPVPTQIFFDLLIYVNFYQYPKDQAISLICSRDRVDWKILQLDWPRIFWPRVFIQAILISVIRHKKLNFTINFLKIFVVCLFVFVFAYLLSYWNSFAIAVSEIKIKRYLQVLYMQLFDHLYIHNIHNILRYTKMKI